MAGSGTYLLIATAVILSGAAMGWSALPPEDGPGDTVTVAAQSALSDVADWYRRGPADGNPDWEAASMSVYQGDAGNGADLIKLYGCGACHAIPGIRGADGSVGPPLGGLASRAYIAGVLPNGPGGLVRWLVNPTAHSPQTAMPDLGVSEAEARDMAAYLFTLRRP